MHTGGNAHDHYCNGRCRVHRKQLYFYMLKEHPQDRIVCLDSLTYAGNLSTLAPVMDQPNFRFVKLDICDRPGVYTLLRKKNRM